jgi:hypothetical protein
MWLYIKSGFYSIVHKPPCNESELLVRARCKEDVERLRNLLNDKFGFNGEIIESPKSDYAYRMVIPKILVASFMARTAVELDYGNFKDTIPDKDYLRHDAYLRCWKVMFDWQKDIKKSNNTDKYKNDN